MSLRIWTTRILLAAFVAAPAFGGGATGAAAVDVLRHITINAPASTSAGSMCCVFVSAPGHPGTNVDVEIDGKAIQTHIMPVGDSGYVVCFVVPPGASGETIDVVVTSGNASGSATINVL